MSHTDTPVFLHIPKSGGTYLTFIIQQFLTNVCNNEFKDIMNNRRVEIVDKNFIITVFCEMLDDYYKRDPNVVNGTSNKNALLTKCSYNTFKQYIVNNNAKILTIIVQQTAKNDIRPGWFSAWELIQHNGTSPVNWIFLRDVFDRQQSLFNYLKSPKSAHEHTHGKIPCDTFEDYLLSAHMEDSWLIRNLTGMPDSIDINNRWFDLANSFISENHVNITAIEDMDNTLDKTYKHDISFRDFLLKYKSHFENKILLNSNISNTKNTTINDISPSAIQSFLSRTKWDRKMYNKYIMSV